MRRLLPILLLFPVLLQAQTANKFIRAKTTGLGYEETGIVGANGISVVNTTGTTTINGTTVYTALSNGATAMAFGTNSTVKVTPTASASYTSTVPSAGYSVYLIILTSGTVSYTITFSTGFKSTGTIATGTTTAKTFVVHFISDGTTLIEAGRTTAQ